MSYEIEKNVPMKHKKDKERFTRKYPFADMDIGDSFKVEPENRERVRVASAVEGTRKGKRFKIALDENDQIRCWRLE